jgi:hypothetical protein
MSWSTQKQEGGMERLDLGSASAAAASASTAEHVGDAVERRNQRRRDGRHTLSVKANDQRAESVSWSQRRAVAGLDLHGV